MRSAFVPPSSAGTVPSEDEKGSASRMAFVTATCSEKGETPARGTASSRQDVWPWQNKTFAPGRSETGECCAWRGVCARQPGGVDLARSDVQFVAGLRVARLEVSGNESCLSSRSGGSSNRRRSAASARRPHRDGVGRQQPTESPFTRRARPDRHFHDLRDDAGSRMLEVGWLLHHVQKCWGTRT
jgi:hypothetical protein